MDVFSVTTGVFALLATCVKVSSALKDFYDGAAIADTRIKTLLTDVESFVQVLQLMKDTLDQEKVRSSFQTTGHIGTHWRNVASSIEDSQLTLNLLQTTLERAGKNVKYLDGSRKHIRLKSAMEEIIMFQQQIQVYRDTLQLSLQTVVLWNQITFQESADKILVNLDELHHAIRRIASDINSRMTTLETRGDSNSKNEEISALSNLRKCVESAASVVSSASTSLGVDHSEHFSIVHGSEFGELFPSQPSPTMLRWISSNTVYEFSEGHDTLPNQNRRKRPNGKDIAVSSVAEEINNSDSDSDLEHEIVQALIQRGKERIATEDFGGAERLFRNCLSRMPSSGSLRSSSRIEVMNILLSIYVNQENWAGAQDLLIQKVAQGSRGTSRENSQSLFDMLALVEVLLKKDAYAEALLYARRALKGYRKLGSSGSEGIEKALELLVRVCHASNDIDEEEAYSAMLARHRKSSTSVVTANPEYRQEPIAAEISRQQTRSRSRTPDKENIHATRYQEQRRSALLAAATEAFRVKTDNLRTKENMAPTQPATSGHREARGSRKDANGIYITSKLHLLEEATKHLVDEKVRRGYNSQEITPNLPSTSFAQSNISKHEARESRTVSQSRNILNLQASNESDWIYSRPRSRSRSQSRSSPREPQSHRDSNEFSPSEISSQLDFEYHDERGADMTEDDRNRITDLISDSAGAVNISDNHISYPEGYLANAKFERDEVGERDHESFPSSKSQIDGDSSTPLNLRNEIQLNGSASMMSHENDGDEDDLWFSPNAEHQDRISIPVTQRTAQWSFFDDGSSKGSPKALQDSKLLGSHHGHSHRINLVARMASHETHSDEPSVGSNAVIAKAFVPTLNSGYLLQARQRSQRIREISRSVFKPLTMVPLKPEVGQKKLVLMGDGAIGKTALLNLYMRSILPVEYDSGVGFNHRMWSIVTKGVHYKFAAADTPGQPEFDQLRCREIETADLILVCFAINNPDSLENITERWRPDYKVFRTQQNRRMPWMLVGLKADLREDPATIQMLSHTGQHPVTLREGQLLSKTIGALGYVECSALTGEGIEEVFDEAAVIILGGLDKGAAERPSRGALRQLRDDVRTKVRNI